MADLDEQVKSQLKEMNENLVNLDNFLGNIEHVDYETVTNDMTPMEKAKYNITIAYALNSVFWMYLRSFGEDPQSHKIKDELDRIKAQIQRLKQIADKSKRPKVDTEAAGRMIKHGIYDSKQSNKRKRKTPENWEDETTESKK